MAPLDNGQSTRCRRVFTRLMCLCVIYKPFESITDIEWRLIYVSAPDRQDLDQELDDCLVGPVPVGTNSFEFESSPLNPKTIPADEVIGIAALILTASYNEQEFVRVGYYVRTEYDNEEMKETPPSTVMFDRLVREINTKPRVTRFQIKWCVRTFCLNGSC